MHQQELEMTLKELAKFGSPKSAAVFEHVLNEIATLKGRINVCIEQQIKITRLLEEQKSGKAVGETNVV